VPPSMGPPLLRRVASFLGADAPRIPSQFESCRACH